jgi:hypothetical protein
MKATPARARKRVREEFEGEVKLGTFNGLPYVDKPYKQGNWILPLDSDKFVIGDRVRVTVERLPREKRGSKKRRHEQR